MKPVLLVALLAALCAVSARSAPLPAAAESAAGVARRRLQQYSPSPAPFSPDPSGQSPQPFSPSPYLQPASPSPDPNGGGSSPSPLASPLPAQPPGGGFAQPPYVAPPTPGGSAPAPFALPPAGGVAPSPWGTPGPFAAPPSVPIVGAPGPQQAWPPTAGPSGSNDVPFAPPPSLGPSPAPMSPAPAPSSPATAPQPAAEPSPPPPSQAPQPAAGAPPPPSRPPPRPKGRGGGVVIADVPSPPPGTLPPALAPQPSGDLVPAGAPSGSNDLSPGLAPSGSNDLSPSGSPLEAPPPASPDVLPPVPQPAASPSPPPPPPAGVVIAGSPALSPAVSPYAPPPMAAPPDPSVFPQQLSPPPPPAKVPVDGSPPPFSPSPEPLSPSPAPLSPSPIPLSPSPEPLPPPPPSPEPLSPSPAPAPVPAPPPAVNTQAEALLAFQAGLTSQGPTNSLNWGTANDNPCSSGWVGVQCDASNQTVTGLNLTGWGLQGTISPSIASGLPGLQLVDLSDQTSTTGGNGGLTGTLPGPWQNGTGNAGLITTLLLAGNLLSGPLPDLKLPSLATATLHSNQFTGSVPASWASWPASSQITLLPQSTPQGLLPWQGLCGTLPAQPSLYMVDSGGSWFQLSNTSTLGSCMLSPGQCSNPAASLENSSLFAVAAQNGSTVWDAAAYNGWAGQNTSATSANLPCYASGGGPAKLEGGQPYLGGDMAFTMVAWSNSNDSQAAASIVGNTPGRQADCGKAQGDFWAVDLRYPLTISQVVIQAGPNSGISGADILVYSSMPVASNRPNGQAQGSPCATGISLKGNTTTITCSVTGRYLALSSGQAMELCSVEVYPEVANAALNQNLYYTAANGSVVTAVNTPGLSLNIEPPSNGGSPVLVLSLGSAATVAAVSANPAGNVASVAVSTTNPLASAAGGSPAPAPSRRRRLSATALPSATTCSQSVSVAKNDASSWSCNAVIQAGYVVITGNAGTNLSITGLTVYLGLPPTAPPPPPPPPAPPAPPPSQFQAMWVGNLLVGGNIGSFVNAVSEPYISQLLGVYNKVWQPALAAGGHSMNTSASRFAAVKQNVSDPSGSPYYYEGSATGANLFTNTTILVDSSVTTAVLTQLLDTPAVDAAIQGNLTQTFGGAYGNVDVWMLPYSSPAPPPPPPPSSSSGISTGAIIGIACGVGGAILAVAALIFFCMRRRRKGPPRRLEQMHSKDSIVPPGHYDDQHHGDMEAGALPPRASPYGMLYQGGDPQKGMPGQGALDSAQSYGAFSNGAQAAALGAAAGAGGALAIAALHSRNGSGGSSSGGAGGAGGSVNPSNSREVSTPRGSEDPLLEWILKTQSTPNARSTAYAASAAAAAAVAAEGASSGSGSNKGSTPKHSRHASGSKAGLDVRVWQFSFADLEIQKQIGEGSFGRVYLAKWRETLVAVKILLNTGVDIEDQDDAERALTLSNPVLESLEKEASMMAALRHPNVVAFLGVCPSPPSVATEYCGRGSLTDVLRGGKFSSVKAKQLDWARRLNMALDAAKGMLYLHEHAPPIIHRDLKSPNLLVDKHWRVKVSDFNLSKLMEDNAVMSSMAATNPRWLAPEILGGHKASLESDVYAFGVVLWELLTWEIPWGATNPWQVVTIVTEGGRLEVPDQDKLPGPDSKEWVALDAYVGLMSRCWAQSPADRPPFKKVIADLRDMLERTLAAKGVLGAGSAAGGGGGAQSDGTGGGFLTGGDASSQQGGAGGSEASASRSAAGGGLPSGAGNTATVQAVTALHRRDGSTPASPVAGVFGSLAGSGVSSEAGTPLAGVPELAPLSQQQQQQQQQ